MFIVSNTRICVGGIVSSYGGNGGYDYQWSLFAGGGSGGAVRLLAPQITGKGAVVAYRGCGNYCAGDGYVRLDVLDDQFFGTLVGSASRGFNPILVAPPQSATLAIQSVAGNAVPPNPTGVLVTPDVAIAGQQGTPIAVVVRCANISLGTPITVVVKGVNGPMVLGTGYNNAGTLASSTATVQVSVPRGGGTIYATVATGH